MKRKRFFWRADRGNAILFFLLRTRSHLAALKKTVAKFLSSPKPPLPPNQSVIKPYQNAYESRSKHLAKSQNPSSQANSPAFATTKGNLPSRILLFPPSIKPTTIRPIISSLQFETPKFLHFFAKPTDSPTNKTSFFRQR